MSEGNHSPETAPVSNISNPRPRSRWTTILGGTAVMAFGAGVLFQVLRPEPAASQTAEKPAAKRPASTQTAATGEMLARVNNQTIPYDQVARECVERHGKDVLENMINRLLIQQECDRQGVTISKADVEQEIATITKKFNLPIDQWYAMLAQERGVTPQQYQNDVIWPMLALRKLAGLQAETKVSEADMLQAFERDYGPRVKARCIVLAGNVRQSDSILKKCKAEPDKFEDFAAEFSTDPNTRTLGGAMPPIRKYGGATQIEEVAFKMKPGEISPVIEFQGQHWILKCEGHTDQVVTDPKEVWDELYAQVTEEKTQLAVANTFTEIKDRAEIHNYLDRTSSTPSGKASTAKTAVGAAAKAPVKPASGTRTAPGRAAVTEE
jgi:foldase protein PrsA